MEMKRIILSVFACVLVVGLFATTRNVARDAHVTASSFVDMQHQPQNVADGIIRICGKGSWRSTSKVTFWGEINYPWIRLDWDRPVTVSRVILYGLPEGNSHVAGGMLRFSDGSNVRVLNIPDDGAPCEVTFAPKTVHWMKLDVTDGDGAQLGLSEIEVMESPEACTRPVELADPYIETTRGRYFFFVTGSQPYGMIGAAPLTRNKNQDGGGYNYNSQYVLGFPQIHGWMISGLELMPIAGDVVPGKGEEGWRSRFSHQGEVVQPGYHRLYLDRYQAWVEQTAADRASLYRITYSRDTLASLLVNLGGYVSTTTMTNAHARKTGANRIEGYFDTGGRLWGGPDRVRVFFVVETSKPFLNTRVWTDGGALQQADVLSASDALYPRNAGQSYADAPSSGLMASFQMQAGEPLLVKSAISYTSVANAADNLNTACSGWDFDALRAQSQQQWNEWLSRIEVKGGTTANRVKFYTDLWHVLLGRHKIDDASGDYPDYTQCDSITGNFEHGSRLKVRHLALDKKGNPLHHIYNSDAFWLSQWNLNPLWGIAYPEVLDDFAASLIQMSLDGGMLPRGPNCGAYSFIMSGCPATSLICSAYQQGLSHNWQPTVALREMEKNHLPGGMMGHGNDEGLRFYIRNGYCPDNAGLTIQWAFEDYGLSEMAAKMGQKKMAKEFLRRSAGWEQSFHPTLKLVLPRRADGTWLHTNPLKGMGYIEANAWQATFGLSHALPRLAQLMGGQDSLCSRLDYAFWQSATENFIAGYSHGYVSYANQPGLSNAHVFTHAGKPWLTQYWVRRVLAQTYSGTTPDEGYGGHDEDQGQMSGVSALMAMGLFAIDGCETRNPVFDITSPVFDIIVIHLNRDYYKGEAFTIRTHDNSADNCYIQRLSLNGKNYDSLALPHAVLTAGGTLDVWLGKMPNVHLLFPEK
jgi:predicted alpha-1,2-mannosidase